MHAHNTFTLIHTHNLICVRNQTPSAWLNFRREKGSTGSGWSGEEMRNAWGKMSDNEKAQYKTSEVAKDE